MPSADTHSSNNATAVLPTDTSVSKATTVTAATSTVSGKSADGSLKIVDEGAVASLNNSTSEIDPDLTEPLRIGTAQMMFEARLTGSSSNLASRESLLLRRRDTFPSRSGSESPLHRSSHTFDGGSSISSLEDQGIDADILTDKMGVLELDLKTQQEISQSLNRSLSNLPPVNERLRDETLEDCHAFTDLKREGTLSRGGSITTGGEVTLEPLEEIDDEGETNEKTSKIKITNLAEILEAPDEEEIGETAAKAGTDLAPSN